MQRKSQWSQAGFTLIELLVVIVIGLVLLTLTVAPLQKYVHRAQLEQTARQTSSFLQVARREAIKRNLNSNVVFDFTSNTVYGYVDTNNNNVFDVATETKFGVIPMPQQVAFWGSGDASPKGANAIDVWNTNNICSPSCPTGGLVTFKSDGSVFQAGAVRFGDRLGNFLEVRVAALATNRIEIRKYDAASLKYLLRYENNKGWSWN